MGSDHGPARLYRNGEVDRLFFRSGDCARPALRRTELCDGVGLATYYGRLSDARLRASPTTLVALLCRTPNRRNPLARHERCERDSIDADGDAHRFHQTARDADRGHSLSADHELAIVPLDPASLAGPRSR